jgi:hypothetical protein
MLSGMIPLFHDGDLAMKARAINKDKLHAALCIAASATVSLVIIFKAIQWLF